MKTIFTNLTRLYCTNKRLSDQLWNEIETVYSHPKRHYHTLAHLQHLLEELDEVKDQVEDWDSLLFSVFYHDIVYNPLRRDNEERSVVIAENRLSSIEVPENKIEKCKALILATKAHTLSPDNDTNFFTDADLSILGQDWNTYHAYASAIRKEYALYPDMIYKPGRQNVVQHFLKMETIYKTGHFISKYENLARKNLQQELEEISIGQSMPRA